MLRINGLPHCLYFNFLVFKLVLFVVVVAAALFVFGGLHFDLHGHGSKNQCKTLTDNYISSIWSKARVVKEIIKIVEG